MVVTTTEKLSVAGKVFAQVILKRLQVLIEHVYSESQHGFHASRSTVGMAFTLRQEAKVSRRVSITRKISP